MFINFSDIRFEIITRSKSPIFKIFLFSANDPTIYLARGQTYEFVNNSGGSHPFEIRVSDGGSAYNTGVTNNGASSGTIKFEVPFAAPNTLVYQCTNHSSMLGSIVIYPSI